MNMASNHARGRNGLPRFKDKLRRKEPMAVAFLGGSITEGYGASDPDATSWRALTERYFAARYPDVQWRFVNAGVGGTNSSLGAHRFQSHALQEGPIDLLFIEFAVNDGQKRGRTPEGRAETLRGMEGIVRQFRAISPSADIVLLYSADEDNLAESDPFFIAVHEEVADRYGLPSVSFRGAVSESIGENRETWHRLVPDGAHPNDAGYALYADTLRRYLERELAETARYEEEERPDALRIVPLPNPLLANNYERAFMMGANLSDWTRGMRWSGEPGNLVNWRYPAGHLAAERPGGEIGFETVGRGVGLLLLCGPDSGIFEYSVNGGAFVSYDPFDEWCPMFYRPVMAPLADFAFERRFRVTVRSTTRKNERSAGTAFRVLACLRH